MVIFLHSRIKKTVSNGGLLPCASTPLRIEACPIVERFLGSDAGGRQSRVEVGTTNRIFFRQTFTQKYGEAADEGITRSCAVNAVHRKGRNMFASVLTGNETSIGSECNDHSPDSPSYQFVRAFLGIVHCLHCSSCDRFGFTLIRDKIVEILERGHLDRLRRRGIQDATDAVLAGECDGVVDGLDGNLELQHDAVSRLQHLRGGVDVRRFHRIIGPFDDQDAVLPVGLNEDGSHAARQPFDLSYVRRIDSLFAEIFDRRGAEQVTAHSRNHEDFGAAEARGYRLVCAFASKAQVEPVSKDRFAALRESVGECRQVDVGAAYYRNSRTSGHDGFLRWVKKGESSQRARRMSMEPPIQPAYFCSTLRLACYLSRKVPPALFLL